MQRFLSPDPAEGSGSPPANPPSPPSTDATPPPAARVVVEGGRSEREVELESDLESERAARKAREVRISELEDENHRLKTVTTPAKPKSKMTFFDE